MITSNLIARSGLGTSRILAWAHEWALNKEPGLLEIQVLRLKSSQVPKFSMILSCLYELHNLHANLHVSNQNEFKVNFSSHIINMVMYSQLITTKKTCTRFKCPNHWMFRTTGILIKRCSLRPVTSGERRIGLLNYQKSIRNKKEVNEVVWFVKNQIGFRQRI